MDAFFISILNLCATANSLLGRRYRVLISSGWHYIPYSRIKSVHSELLGGHLCKMGCKIAVTSLIGQYRWHTLQSVGNWMWKLAQGKCTKKGKLLLLLSTYSFNQPPLRSCTMAGTVEALGKKAEIPNLLGASIQHRPYRQRAYFLMWKTNK